MTDDPRSDQQPTDTDSERSTRIDQTIRDMSRLQALDAMLGVPYSWDGLVSAVRTALGRARHRPPRKPGREP
jgi:hypothetical protein